ncbi:Acetyl esterase/lipase [Eubacterium ruminantium]|nr:Acetyl esterase/lipase [Eubacterium ruminantium]
MNYKTITLSEERNVTLTTYLIEGYPEYQPAINRPLILICPGGGYSHLSRREAEPIALRYLNAGFHAAVLLYGIQEHAVAPGPLRDIAGAVAYLRKNREAFHIDNDQIYVCGFSAGAHVACQLGVFWNNKDLLPEYSNDFSIIKPNGMILGYPVIDLHASATHLDIGIQPGVKPSEVIFDQKHPKMPAEEMIVFDPEEGRCFINFEKSMNAYIFDGEYTPEQEDFYSLQNQVTPDTAPAFIWHADGDGLIDPSNSLCLASALHKNKVPVELHIFAGGGHGIALADYTTAGNPYDYYPYAKEWMNLSIEWIRKRSDLEKQILDSFN